ncbi:MAG: PQQ-binding-like beta-propeller repeat protein [Pirellulales bacterium]|nr:PQQ-binding-like beta-propeller repeat protein [Pirellulales bacterium]
MWNLMYFFTRILNFRVIVAFYVFGYFSSVQVFGDDSKSWSSFRGGTRLGNNGEQVLPLEWSAQNGLNIKWHKEINGIGHSSPVIYDNKILVTSAFQDDSHVFRKKAIVAIESFLMALAFIMLVKYTLHDTRDILDNSFLITHIMIYIMYFLSLIFTINGETLFDYARCPIRYWIGLHITILINVVLTSTLFPAQSKWNPGLGLAALFLIVLYFYYLPNREHIWRNGFISANGIIGIITPVILLVYSILILTRYFCAIREHKKATSRIFITVSIFFLFTVVISSIIAAFFILTVDTSLKAPTFSSMISWLTMVTFFSIPLLLWIRVLMINNLYDGTTISDYGYYKVAITVFCALTFIIFCFASCYNTVQYCTFLTYHFDGFSLSKAYLHPATILYASIVTLLAGLSLTIRIAGLKTILPKWNFHVNFLRHIIIVLLFISIAVRAIVYLNDNIQNILGCCVTCLDANTGKVSWEWKGLYGKKEIIHRANSHATATPVVYQDSVIAYFGNKAMICIDRNGKLKWKNSNLTHESAYGYGSSLVQYDGIVIICCGGPKSSMIYGIDADTGNILWQFRLQHYPNKVSGLNRTPTILNKDQIYSVLVWDVAQAVLLDLKTGNLLDTITLEESYGDMVSSPASQNNKFYTANTQSIESFDINSSSMFDKNSKWRIHSSGANCSSPVICGKNLFCISDRGILSCIDTISRKQVKKIRLSGTFYSSIISSSNYIYVTNTDGVTYVITANKNMTLVSHNDLGEPVYATIVPHADKLYIRTINSVYCIAK